MKSVPVSVQMTAQQVADTWLAAYTSDNTRLAYGSDLRAFLDWFDDDSGVLAADQVVLAHYRAEREASGLARTTVDRQFAALRAFYAAACELGACSESPFGARRRAHTLESATGVLTSAECDRLLDASGRDLRTAVLVQLLLGEGIRLTEVLGLDRDDVSGSVRSKRLRIRRHGRPVEIPIDPANSRSIDRLQRAATADSDGPLLTGPPRGGRSMRLTRFGADHLLKQSAAAAGIERPVSANVLRRTHVTIADRAGVHIEDIRHRMGHRDLRTTRRYLPPGSHQLET